MPEPKPLTAAQRSRFQQLQQIQEVAVALALEKGFDGFTMDEVAERTGLSRRTVFNRVGDKMSAVLGVHGEDPGISAEEVFGDAGQAPLEALVRVAVAYVRELDLGDGNFATHSRIQELLAREPRLAEESRRRRHEDLAGLAGLVREHEGWADDDPRPGVLARVFTALFDEAADRVVAAVAAGREVDLSEELQRVADALRSLLGVPSA